MTSWPRYAGSTAVLGVQCARTNHVRFTKRNRGGFKSKSCQTLSRRDLGQQSTATEQRLNGPLKFIAKTVNTRWKTDFTNASSIESGNLTVQRFVAK